ncbi:MAG: PD-(D/E)XK nuclease family protein, partial [Armatimonadetes bacterium]|nr:PD-(D/E)XK nuclease family protein [Armatimonadota bacterium]
MVDERKPKVETADGIEIRRLYAAADAGVDYTRDLGFPGEYPFTRGIHPTMYRGRLWTMRQYAGFGTAEESNERYRYLAALAAGDRCVLSFPRGNPGAQRGQFPSRWFLEAATRLHGTPVYTSNLWSLGSAPWLTVVASMEDGLRTLATEAPVDVHDRDVHALWRWRRAGRPVVGHYLASGHLARALALEQGRGAHQLTQWDGDVSAISDGARRLRLLDRPVLSATSLEAWATCPFRYLLGHVLGVAALEQPEEVATISPLEKGSLIHGV